MGANSPGPEEEPNVMRILLLNGHPDAGSLCDALAASYAAGANEGGHDIRCVALRELEFDLVLRGGFHSAKPLEPDIKEQELIQWCEHLVVVSPNWWWSAPALLKAISIEYSCPDLRCAISGGFRTYTLC